MTDEQLRQLYERVTARRAAASGDYAVSPERMLEVLTGHMAEAERHETLLAIMKDPRCRQEFDLLRAVVAGAEWETARRPVRSTWALSLAASVALLVGAGLAWRAWMQRSAVEPVREGVEGAAIRLVSPPPGTRPAADARFVWSSVPRALHYEFNLVTTGGRLIYTATLSDTVLALPDSVRLVANVDLRWWVEATTSEGLQARSALRPLTISP